MHRPMIRAAVLSAYFGLLCAAQTPSTPPEVISPAPEATSISPPSPDDIKHMTFYQLRQKRDETEAGLRKEEQPQKNLDKIVYYLTQESMHAKQLENLKKAHGSKQDIAKLKAAVATDDASAATDMTLPLAQKKLAELDESIAKDQKTKDLIEQRMNELVDIETPKQSFKTEMSFIYAGLVAIVIAGFFFISWHDGWVRRGIFSGQAGIQFLTLFSLVIAIILFGITDILEGKELAALLGGLSGYILGRSSLVADQALAERRRTPEQPGPEKPPSTLQPQARPAA